MIVMRPILILALCTSAFAQLQTAKIDEIAAKALEDSGAPSVSIAIVRDGKIAFEKAYGNARLAPLTPAKPEMRYSIGSISKQLLASTILLLVEDGKLSLDDRVSKYLPDLTRANDVTIRNLLTHTSGYQDYYPQDYLPQFMELPVTASEIIDRWAKKPLDFDPGTRYQYSNTNFVIAGRIVEMAAGMPFFEFLSKRILQPLHMSTAINLADQRMGAEDAAGYTRFALGPARPVKPEALGWLFAAGELAMTAHDLALWDIALMDRKILSPASTELLTTPFRLKNGTPLGYALGIGVANAEGHPRWQHAGGVSGFVSLNTMWPDSKAAIIVFANHDGSTAPSQITAAITPLLLAQAEDPATVAAVRQARLIFNGLLDATIDRKLLTPNADAYFTLQVLADARASLKLLGPLIALKHLSVELRGGMTYRHFEMQFKDKTLALSTLTMPDGKLEQYLIQ
jgi:D-alanyl-D-alanine carboxypeptidase